MSPGRWVAVGILLGALILAVFAALRSTEDAQPAPAPAPAEEEPQMVEAVEPVPQEDGPDDEAKPLGSQSIVVYYPSARRHGLQGERREIFATSMPGDRAKQILADLIAGPASNSTLRALPAGTRLRQVFVMPDGVAFVDFSSELEGGLGGGSAEELLTVYSIIDSVALNVAEIRRVGILVNGKPVDTLNGHVDLRRPLPPDRSLIVGDAL